MPANTAKTRLIISGYLLTKIYIYGIINMLGYVTFLHT